jgi:hypothetical protein
MRKHVVAITMTAAMLGSGAVYAGYKESTGGRLAMHPEEGWFQGAFGTVRNYGFDEPLSYLTCGTAVGASGNYAFCFAYDGPGPSDPVGSRFAGCITFDPAAIETVRSLGPDDYVHVDYDLTTGDCIGLFVQKSSIWEPKQP